MGNLFKVHIDFATSHLVFPAIIAVVLVILGLAIAVRDRRRIAAAPAYWSGIWFRMDRVRLIGTIAVSIVYFVAMQPVGRLYPNTGLGFLICSIPYIFAVGMLYLHHRTSRQILPVAVTAVVAPTLVWWLFSNLFRLTLP